MEEFAAWFRENVRIDVEQSFYGNDVTIHLQVKEGDEWKTTSYQNISIPDNQST